MYPKTHVAGQSLINALNGISEPEENGWYLYNGEYYAKVVATPNTFNSGYVPEFDDGVEIYAGETYWFKVEPILWKYCKDDAFKKCGYLISEYLLDAQIFYSSKQSRIIGEKTVYPNNYEYSDIRTWLNGDFAAKAFSLSDYNLVEANTDNGKSSTNNAKGSYYCNDSLDRVFLPSYKELTDFTYGFSGSNDEDRRAFTTDYSRAVGASFMNGDDAENGYVKFSAGYWTRSPDNSSFGQIYTVTTVQTTGYIAGYLANDYVDDVNVAVRPVINFRLD